MTDPLSNRRLRSLYHHLVSMAERSAIPREDAEELANDTLLAVLERFDPARGRVETYAQTILMNKIRNFVRDHKIPAPVPFDDERHAAAGTPEDIVTRREEMEMMKKRRAQLLTALNEEEVRFLLEFEVVLDQLGDRAVSETARRLDLTPQEGHNTLQRIERKARKLASTLRAADETKIRSVTRPEPEEIAPEADAMMSFRVFSEFGAAFSRAPRTGYDATTDISRAALEWSVTGLDRFMKALDPTRREKLLAFLS